MLEKICFEHVSFSYAGSDKKVLSDVSFAVNADSFTLLMGKSGCGKSTLLRQCKKSLIPHGMLSGSVKIFGVESSNMDDRCAASDIGFVTQDPDAQIVTDKVWHELSFGLESLGYDTQVIKRRVGEMAAFFGITTWIRRDTDTLSGGEKQLLNLASIMVMRPKLIILDEPTAQLDPIAARDFIQTLVRINREFGTGILISEHRIEELFGEADNVLLMHDSSIYSNNSPQKTIEYLISHSKETKDFIHLLPTAARIYCMYNEDLKIKSDNTYPLSVRQGREWIRSVAKKPETKGMLEEQSKEIDTKLSLKNIWFRYSKYSNDVLRGANISIPNAKWSAIVGSNGCGKSTVLNVIAGNIKPYRGKVDSSGAKICMLPQDPKALFTQTEVEDEIIEALYGTDIPTDKKIELANNMLEFMELSDARKTHPYDLSGGEQQRLGLGKILLQNPDVLLLDEPTKGLDPEFKIKLADILNKRKEEGLTIVMVSHDIEFCAAHSDFCSLMFDGQTLPLSPTRNFFSGNFFFTTAANRIAGDVFSDVILDREVIDCLKEK